MNTKLFVFVCVLCASTGALSQQVCGERSTLDLDLRSQGQPEFVSERTRPSARTKQTLEEFVSERTRPSARTKQTDLEEFLSERTRPSMEKEYLPLEELDRVLKSRKEKKSKDLDQVPVSERTLEQRFFSKRGILTPARVEQTDLEEFLSERTRPSMEKEYLSLEEVDRLLRPRDHSKVSERTLPTDRVAQVLEELINDI